MSSTPANATVPRTASRASTRHPANRRYQYDFLDRLIYAGVFTNQDVMLEQRLYRYDAIGNLLSAQLTYQLVSKARGSFHVGSHRQPLCPF